MSWRALQFPFPIARIVLIFCIGGLLCKAQIGFAILFGVMGLVALLTGGIVFLRFMRRTVEAEE